jgi:arabinan endo-1,5-alpha-L-arabinosidase
MLRWPLKLIAVAAFALASCATPVARSPVAGTYANPVLDSDFPDPVVLKAPDGFYYAYATQTQIGGKWINIQLARSPDLVNWQHLGDALPAKPDWASKTQDFWAPHVARHGDTYYMYYSAKPDAALSDDKRGLCLAVATAGGPLGPFVDIGKPLQCGEGFVNIDPMSFDDPATGKRLLYWGSGFQPIKVQELAPDRMSFAPGSKPVDLIPIIKDDPNQYERLIEGAWVIRRGGWYYMFYSGNNCCGKDAHYAVLVARSRSATGPFQKFANATGAASSAILETRGTWFAPGHNSIITDAGGREWMVFHAVDLRRARTKPTDDLNTRRILLIDPIVWRDEWPRIDGNGPSTERKRAPQVR